MIFNQLLSGLFTNNPLNTSGLQMTDFYYTLFMRKIIKTKNQMSNKPQNSKLKC